MQLLRFKTLWGHPGTPEQAAATPADSPTRLPDWLPDFWVPAPGDGPIGTGA